MKLCSLDRFLLPRAWVPALNMLLIAFVPGVLLPLLYVGDYIAFLTLGVLVLLTIPFTRMFVKLSHHAKEERAIRLVIWLWKLDFWRVWQQLAGCRMRTCSIMQPV